MQLDYFNFLILGLFSAISPAVFSPRHKFRCDQFIRLVS